MSKKKTQTTKSSSVSKSRPKPAGKAAKKSPADHHHDHCHDQHDDGEVLLDETEKKTIDMVLDSDKIRMALETEVSSALTATIRKFCRQHGAPLSTAQAHNVARVLFGD